MAEYITKTDITTHMASNLKAAEVVSGYEGGVEHASVTVACKQATKIIDGLKYVGTPQAATNAFPRVGQSVVPQDVKDAACHIAIALLDGVDPELEMEALRQTHGRFEQVQLTYDSTNVPVHIMVGVPSAVAWNLLVPYMSTPQGVSISRV